MKVVKKITGGLGWLLSWLYPYKIHRLLSYFLANYFYTGWVKREFKYCGELPFFKRPLYLYGSKNITIGDNFRSEKGLRLETHNEYNGATYTPAIIIGDRVSINFDCHIAAVDKVMIGNDVLIASNVFITDHFHGDVDKDSVNLPTSERILNSKGPVIVEDNVWIGEGVCILPGVTLGKGCIVGAGAVVTKSFPACSVVAGTPARIINMTE